MAARNYTNTAEQLTIPGTLNNTDTTTTFSVSVAPTAWPVAPYFAVINQGFSDEEVIYVTARTTTSFTATRGASLVPTYGSTTVSHAVNATLRFVATAADFAEANAHVNAFPGQFSRLFLTRGN